MIPGMYGDRMARYFQLPSTSVILLNAVPQRQLALTWMSVPNGLDGPSKRIPPERAYSITVHLRRPGLVEGWGSWIDGHFSPVKFWDLGGVEIFNLQADPIVLRPSGFESVHIHIIHQTITSYVETCEEMTFSDLHCTAGLKDDTIFRWVNMLMPFFGLQSQLPSLMIDEVVMTFCSYILKHYQRTAPRKAAVVGGLALWQQRRATRMLSEHLDGELQVMDLASACGLSASHFARAFKRSFGMPVHQYLMQRRIDAAKSLMAHTHKPLVNVALECGFTDQSSFNRSFCAMVGITPGAWKRERGLLPVTITWSDRESLPVTAT